jgi:predicted nuclease of predicted toxin-antitoxin system
MSVAFYMDHHVRRAITDGLRRRAVDVITAAEDGTDRFDDPELLDRSTELQRVLFTHDTDFLEEAARRQHAGEDYAGIVFCRQLSLSIGQCIDELELIAKAGEPHEFANRVTYLPLR